MDISHISTAFPASLSDKMPLDTGSYKLRGDDRLLFLDCGLDSEAGSSLVRAPSDLSVANGVPKETLSILSGFDSDSSTEYGDSPGWWVSKLLWGPFFVKVSPESSRALIRDVSSPRDRFNWNGNHYS